MSDYSYERFFLLKIIYNYSKVPSSETHGVVEINRGFPTMPKFKFPKMFPKCEVSFFYRKVFDSYRPKYPYLSVVHRLPCVLILSAQTAGIYYQIWMHKRKYKFHDPLLDKKNCKKKILSTPGYIKKQLLNDKQKGLLPKIVNLIPPPPNKRSFRTRARSYQSYDRNDEQGSICQNP